MFIYINILSYYDYVVIVVAWLLGLYCAVSAYHHWSFAFESRWWLGVFHTTLWDNVFQLLTTCRWVSPVSSTIKTVRHDITEIFLKVAIIPRDSLLLQGIVKVKDLEIKQKRNQKWVEIRNDKSFWIHILHKYMYISNYFRQNIKFIMHNESHFVEFNYKLNNYYRKMIPQNPVHIITWSGPL